jgi:soluble lytic murein transglycosylase-like protein
MFRSLCIAAALSFAVALPAHARHRTAPPANGNLDGLIARYSAEYNVPESLIRRVIRRESGGNARVISRGNYGLMQIKLATARSMGYSGGVAGLLDPDTNMRYAVKYLSGAWGLAGGSEGRAVHHYASGYYYAAKRRGLRMAGSEAYASAAPRLYAMGGGVRSNGPLVDSGPVLSPASLNYR